MNGKSVEGWVGVLGKGFGSRKKAGFSIIQNRRVIQNGYKSVSIFGEQEDGGNDLINQRVIGELYLDKFSVSHTKDKTVWENDEEDQLDLKLGEFCKDARELALTLRFNQQEAEFNFLNQYKEEAVTVIASELASSEIRNFLETVQPYPETIIATCYNKTLERVKEEIDPVIFVTIETENDLITVVVYFSEKSEIEPYVLSEATIDANKVILIINLLHPHVQEMKTAEALTNFIRHSIYDGVSE